MSRTLTATLPHAFSITATDAATTPSRAAVRTGYALSAVAALFLTFDAVVKLLMLPMVVSASAEMGFSNAAIFEIGVIAAVCLVLYVIPRTAVLGAVLWTGYLGGAIATHVRLGNPLFTHQLFPIYVAALIWGGLWLRDPRVRALLPIVRSRAI